MSDQDEIDSLLNENTASEASAQEQNSSDPSSLESTGESASNQEELNSAQNSENAVPSNDKDRGAGFKGVPWVDYIPRDTRPKPKSLVETIAREQEDLESEMEECEMKVLTYVKKKGIHRAYYQDWVRAQNDYFRAAMLLKGRKLVIASKHQEDDPEESNAPIKESEATEREIADRDNLSSFEADESIESKSSDEESSELPSSQIEEDEGVMDGASVKKASY